MVQPERAEPTPLLQLKTLLEKVKPLLETRLVMLNQEHEHNLIPGVSLKLAKQRLNYVNWVLGQSPTLEVALRVCASLIIDLKALSEAETKHGELLQAFTTLYLSQGYLLVNNMLQPQDGPELTPDAYAEPQDYSP
jgi:hypothetical protein